MAVLVLRRLTLQLIAMLTESKTIKVFLRSLLLVIVCIFALEFDALSNICTTALPIACGDNVNGSTAGEPTSGMGACVTSTGSGGAMWYTFTGDGATWTFETTVASYDTKIWVFSGDCSSLTCVTGNDDGGAGTLSLVNFATTAGETYYVVVGGYAANEGTYTLNVTGTPCNNASSCGTAAYVACGNVYNGSTIGNANSGLGTCTTSNGTGGAAWYTFVGDGNNWSFETTSASYDTKIWVYSGTCGALNCVTGNDDGGVGTLSLVSFTASLGVTYYVIVGGYAGNQGTYTLSATSSPCGVVPSLTAGPGGVTTNVQLWLKAEMGTTGNNPVSAWANQGVNTAIPQVTSNVGTTMLSGENHNYNNGIRMSGGTNYINGVFSATTANRSALIPGNQVTMFTVYSDGGYDLSLSFHSQGNSVGQWHAFAFRHAGLGTLSSSGNSFLYGSTVNRSTNILGMKSTSGSAGTNTFNGIQNTTGNVGNFTTNTGGFLLCVGLWPGYANNNITSENIIFDRELTPDEFHRVESYLAIKYGVTLGVNGTSVDYNSSDNTVVWDQSANAGYNYDIAGVMRDDNSALSQLKSHSVEGGSFGSFNDVLTVANGTNFASPTGIAADRSSLLWGHNNGPALNTGTIVNYPTDNGETIETIFQRIWKSQETGTVSTVTLEFDLSSVVGVGGLAGINDLSAVRLLVDEDGDFTNGATSIAPTSYNNTTDIVYFQNDFTPFTGNHLDQFNGYYFTIGSTDATVAPLPVELSSLTVQGYDCSNTIEWTTLSETNSDYFIIERSYTMTNWEPIAKMDAAGNSQSSLDYLYRDLDFEESGMVYYRLRQVDFNGNIHLVGIRSVESNCLANAVPVIYPNPTNGVLNIETPVQAVVRILDLNGRALLERTISKGGEMVDIRHLTSGSYMVVVEYVGGKSFVKQLAKI